MFREAMHDLLARPFIYVFRTRVQEMNALLEQAPTFAQVGRRFCLEDELNFPCDIFDICDLQSLGHPAARPHRIDRNGELRFLSSDDWLLE